MLSPQDGLQKSQQSLRTFAWAVLEGRVSDEGKLIDRLTKGKGMVLQYSGLQMAMDIVRKEVKQIETIARNADLSMDKTVHALLALPPYIYDSLMVRDTGELESNAKALAALGLDEKNVWRKALVEPRLLTDTPDLFITKVSFVAAALNKSVKDVAASFLKNSETVVPVAKEILVGNFERAVAGGRDRAEHADLCLKSPLYLSFPLPFSALVRQ